MMPEPIRTRLVGIASLASRALNVIVLGGTADETTSMRLYLERRKGGAWALFARVVNILFRWQSEDHVRWSARQDSDHGKHMSRRVRRALDAEARKE